MSSDGSSSFQKVLDNASDSSQESGAASGQQMASLTASRGATTAQGSRKSGTLATADHGKASTANPRSKGSHSAGASISSTTTADASAQTPPVLSQTETASTSVPGAGFLLPFAAAVETDTAGSTVTTGGGASATGSTLVAGFSAGNSIEEKGNAGLPTSSAPATPPALATSSAQVTPPASAGSPNGSSSVLPSVLASSQDVPSSAPVVAGAGGMEEGGDSTASTDALTTGSASGTSAVAEARQPHVNGEATMSALSASAALKMSSASSRVGVEGASRGRTAKASAPTTSADHEGKHKTAGSTSGSDDGEEASAAPSVEASGSSAVESRPDSQPSPAAPATLGADLTMVQQQLSTAHGSTPGTPDNSTSSAGSGSTGASDAGSVTAATQSSASAPWNLSATGSLPAVNSAQLIHSVRHAEMRMGMQSEEFGSMSISTSLSRQVLSAQITTDHSELGRALAAHLPVMEQKLSTAYGVQAKVELSSGASSTGTTSDQPQQGGGRQQPSSSKAVPFSPASTMSGTSASPPADMAVAAAESSRLDIRV